MEPDAPLPPHIVNLDVGGRFRTNPRPSCARLPISICPSLSCVIEVSEAPEANERAGELAHERQVAGV